MPSSADARDGEHGGFSVDDAWWGAAMIGPTGTVIAANDTFAAVLGLRAGDLVGRVIGELAGDLDLTEDRAVAARLVAGEGPVIEYPRRIDAAGASPWEGVVRMSLLADEDGTPELFHVRLVEAGSRKPPERIAWREGDFPLALDAMRVGVAIIGLDGILLQANRALCEITGRSEDELHRSDLLMITHPDDRLPDVELGTRAWLGELDSYIIEKRIIRPDDSVVWVRQEVTFARDETGQPLHLIGQVIDISDRKEVESELARSRQELTDLVDRIPVGLLSSGPDGLIIRANPAAASIAGLPDMPKGTDVSTLIHPDDLLRIAAITRARVAAGRDYDIEFRIVRPDGAVRWVRNDARPVLDDRGELVGITGTWLDVTDLKVAEEQLRRQATHDALTGLANRSLLFDALALSIERAAAGETTLSILFVDLDGFKAVNDAHGHGIGDRVLSLAARRLESVVESGDVLARFGGDEFIVRCERDGSDPDLLPTDLAERIIAAVSEPFEVDALTIEMGASIGIATWTPGDTADDLVNAADRAVYAAKAAGRSCWRTA